ncbi:T7SS effector LXG polymorphic toxin [Psychrobacillus sp. FSL K6-2684]|uniref:T7SS effector LXG polymorphic toxin n=1 Tax=Psychrobacillus sp. FSL K6-2684 TaxID=2921547 RepID=UPI0030F54935
MKVLDVDLLQDGLQRNITMLERLNTEIKTIQLGVEGLVQMEEQLKGEGGGAIRSFYEECHLPFLQFFQLFSYDSQQVLYQIGKALNSLEPDLSGYILEEFLEGELEQGLTLIGQLTASLTDEANNIMDQVSDIVALPHLDDSAVQEGVISSKRKRDDTLSQLHEFDATQTTALNNMEQDIRTMGIWLSDIEGMFKSGLTDVHFQADNWGAFTAKNNLKTELASRTSPVAVLSSIVNRENQLTTMLEAFIAGNGPIRFGYGGLIGIYNPFVGSDMLALSCARPESNGTEQEDIDQNIFVKSFHSLKGIAEDFWDGARIRREKALDSPYDFVNYWTFGISGGIVSGANERSAKMFDSKLDFLNYATFGFSGMVKEAILPEDPFSKEHWQNSFGFVGSLIGLRLAATPSPVKKPGNAAVDGKATHDGKNVNEGTSNTSEGISKATVKDVTFKKGYDTHLTEVEGFKAKPNIGIKGGHNLENFEQFILDNFGNQVKDINQAVTKTSHPDISGIYEVKYQLPVYDGLSKENGGKGKFTGQWKEYKNPKTVYDPKVFSDEQILKLGREAMEEGISNNRIIQGGDRSPSVMVEGYVNVNGKQLKFMGFKDKNTGEISNFFPVLD